MTAGGLGEIGARSRSSARAGFEWQNLKLIEHSKNGGAYVQTRKNVTGE
jgi:hypothetical protein